MPARQQGNPAEKILLQNRHSSHTQPERAMHAGVSQPCPELIRALHSSSPSAALSLIRQIRATVMVLVLALLFQPPLKLNCDRVLAVLRALSVSVSVSEPAASTAAAKCSTPHITLDANERLSQLHSHRELS